jgi:hypothetical protein
VHTIGRRASSSRPTLGDAYFHPAAANRFLMLSSFTNEGSGLDPGGVLIFPGRRMRRPSRALRRFSQERPLITTTGIACRRGIKLQRP